ncbi:MAG: GTP-binding protein, partial [Oscillospiraceae bacterium]|nr:GTP-binding protein [Oscillospiraceae bacterium]
ETYTVYNCRMVSPVALLWLLERVIRGYFGQIIRAKGILPAGKEWVRFDVVNGKVAITGFDESTENAKAECVWIGRAIDRLALRDYLWDPDSPLAKRRARMKQVKAKKKQQSTPPEENPS